MLPILAVGFPSKSRINYLKISALAPTLGIGGAPAAIVAGSRPNGLPPGIGLHAELRAMYAAGMPVQQILASIGSEAARALRIDGQAGRIEPGLLADLVIVSGDPLHQIGDLIRIVAVIRNGHFYSLVSLLERARTVE